MPLCGGPPRQTRTGDESGGQYDAGVSVERRGVVSSRRLPTYRRAIDRAIFKGRLRGLSSDAMIKAIPTDLPEVIVIEPAVFPDERGFFFESWHAEKFRHIGIDVRFVQDNHSKSAQGTLRGLHYQLPPHAQGKLVRVVEGEVFDVAVDLRRSSPTFGRWTAEILSAANHRMMWIPAGFGHGFYVTSASAQFLYKCTDIYAPDAARFVRWDDPDLAIEWPLVGGKAPALSKKDAAAPRLAAAELFD